MPLYKEWNPNQHSIAAIWHISEPEEFFEKNSGISAYHITHPKRRIEFLAGRFLLQYLNQDFPIHAIFKDEHDKPQIPNKQFHFSISHSFPYVACIIHTHSSVGIDIQCWHKSILSLQHKFLSTQEQIWCNNQSKKITIAWTAKEAAYKFQGKRGIEFKEHLPIKNWEENEQTFNITINVKLLKNSYNLMISSTILEDFALSVAI